MTQYGLGRKLDERTPHAMALHPAEKLISTRTTRSWPHNKLWLDQNGYGTCVGNGLTHRRADGPVQVGGLNEAYAQQLYLDASALFYGAPDTSMQNGTSVLSGCQVLEARGLVDRYTWMTDVAALRYNLLEKGSLVVGTTWYISMFDTPPDGMGHQYVRYNPASGTAGGHCYEIPKVDFDPADGSDPYYLIKNSWGKAWGIGGTARFRVKDFEELVFTGWGEAVLLHELPVIGA